MSNPNPLIPQGTFQAQASKGASNVRIAVATIVAIHVVFFGGLLLQGCKRDTKTNELANAETNAAPSTLTYPPIETGYYTNSANLPQESSSPLFTSAPPATVDTFTSNPPSTVRDTFGASGITPPPPDDAPTGPSKEYTVLRGDTLGKIAAANGISLSALRKANPSVEPTRLRVGMKLQIPAPSPNATVAPSGSSSQPAGNGSSAAVYTVKAGDNLTRVAKNHGVTVSQLRAANNLRTSALRVGQKLKIPTPAGNAGTTRTNAL